MVPLIVAPCTVDLLFTAQHPHLRGALRLDVSSRGLPPFPRRLIDTPAACTAVGERLLRLLSGVAVDAALVGGRHPEVPKPEENQRLRIMPTGHNFEQFLHPQLQHFYGLDPDSEEYAPAVKALAQDFVVWVRVHPEYDRPMGLTAENHFGVTWVYIQCKPPPKVRFSSLEPFEEDGFDPTPR